MAKRKFYADRKLYRSILTSSASAIALAGASGAAFAQDGGEAIDENAQRLGVITVTAEKQAENVQDVSLSVQAFGEEALRLGGITDVSRLEFLLSGVSYAFVGNDAKFNVRGANSSDTYGDQGSIVGTFIDGVYKPRASQQTRAFFDINQVEFLKGPQGTLYGRNTLAGALNVRSNTVDLTGYSAGIDVSYQRFDRAIVEGFVNIPITETFGIRAAGYFDKGDGHIDNLAGPDLGAQDDKGVRLTALWKPNSDIDVTVRYSHIEEDGYEAGLFGYVLIPRNIQENGRTDAFGTVSDPHNPTNGSAPTGEMNGYPNANDVGPYTIAQDYVPNADVNEDVVSLEINWDIGPVTAKSITSYTNFRNFLGFDADFSPNPHIVSGYDEAIESVTQELVFASDYDSRLQWTGGLYYSFDNLFYSYSQFDQTLEDGNRQGDLLTGTPLVSLDTNLNGFYADSAFVEQHAVGVFAQVEYSILDELRLIAGVRYSNEGKTLTGGGDNFTGDTNEDGTIDLVVNVVDGAAGSSPIVVPAYSRDVFTINRDATDAITVRENFDNATWRVGIEYDVSEDILAYISSGSGYLSGALNDNGTITDEQKSIFVEAGVKSTLLEDTLKLNAAIHYTRYQNLLTQVVEMVGDVIVTSSANGGDINAWGIEIESVWLPIENLTLSANLAYVNSRYGRFDQTNPYQEYSGTVPIRTSTDGTIIVNLAGERTPFTPEVTLTLSGAYEFDLSQLGFGEWGYLTPAINFYVSSDFNASNRFAIDPALLQPSFTKTDLRLIWDSPDTKYGVEAFIENIENSATLSRGNNNGSQAVQTGYAYPRNYGIRIRASF